MGMMVFLPLALTVLVCLAAMAMTVKEESRSHSFCEKYGMILQDNLSKSLEALLKLNPKASKLRVKLERLDVEEAAAAASGNEEALPEIRAQIDATRFQQLILDREQRAIITGANYGIQSDAEKWRQKLATMNPVITAPKLQVRRVPPEGLAPEYFPVQNFSAAQAATAHYRMTSAQMFGPAVSKLQESVGHKPSGIYHEACATTIEHVGHSYSPRLWWSQP